MGPALALASWAASGVRRPMQRPEVETPSLTGDGLVVREHFAEPPGADVKDEPPDWNVIRDPWMRPRLLESAPGCSPQRR